MDPKRKPLPRVAPGLVKCGPRRKKKIIFSLLDLIPHCAITNFAKISDINLKPSNTKRF